MIFFWWRGGWGGIERGGFFTVFLVKHGFGGESGFFSFLYLYLYLYIFFFMEHGFGGRDSGGFLCFSPIFIRIFL